MITQVTYRADAENNAETWWDAFRIAYPTLRRSYPELYVFCRELDRDGEMTLHDPCLIERFDAFAMDLPGWNIGPDHAPTALIATAE